MNEEEKRAYAKGYAAGRKKLGADLSHSAIIRAQNRMWRDVFCAALQGTIINARWKTGEKHWSTQSDYVIGAGQLADEAIKQHGHRA